MERPALPSIVHLVAAGCPGRDDDRVGLRVGDVRPELLVLFAAVGSWIGAFASMTFLHRPGGATPPGAPPE